MNEEQERVSEGAGNGEAKWKIALRGVGSVLRKIASIGRGIPCLQKWDDAG